jgi:L-iditol 2-dehydrogenase
MKVGMYYRNFDVRTEEMPVPNIGPGDILLKVMASGICGSDLMEFHRIKKAPLVLGHEISGEIVDVGKDVSEYKPGERIFVSHHVPCDNCRECWRGFKTQCAEFKKVNNFEPGGFAEYIKVTGRSLRTGVLRLPTGMSYEQGTFIEPLGTVVEAGGINKGDSVLVFGCGVAGLLNIQFAKAHGAGRIIGVDINEYRLDKAKLCGADCVFDAKSYTPSLLRDVNSGRLADRVVICTGAKSATVSAFESYEQGGTILFFATPQEKEKVEIDWYAHWRNGLTTKVTYGATPESNLSAFWLINHGVVNVEEMITHTLSLEKIGEGFKLASEAKDCLKVIIKPHAV